MGDKEGQYAKNKLYDDTKDSGEMIFTDKFSQCS